MHPVSTDVWLATALDEAGVKVSTEDQAAWVGIAQAAGFPCPKTPKADLDDHQLSAWRHRALDPDTHLAVYRALLESAGLPWLQAAAALHELHMAAAGWEAYPDAAPVLTRLRDAGIACAVVSNIGWDIRIPLKSAGLLDLLQTVVCSCEEGVRKPDPRLFEIACERLGVKPGPDVIMVGDSPKSDRGGEALGIRTLLVSPARPQDRPNGLAPVLAAAGLT